METAFRSLFQYPWLLFIVVTCANAAIWWKRSDAARRTDPELDAALRRLIRGFLFWINLPFLVMGYSMQTGRATLESYLEADGGLDNPHVAAWFAIVVILWILGTHWLFLQSGAEKLARLFALVGPRNASSARSIKLWWLVGLAGGVASLLMRISKTGGGPG